MADLFDEYNGYINLFCDNLSKEVKQIIEKRQEDYFGKVHLCAIARKTPKLLDILRQQLDDIWDKLIVITEITLPFLNWKDIKVLLLADDAIYYGSTFNSVYQQIRRYTANVRIIPICCIKATELTLPFDKDILTSSVQRSVGHYFVNCLSINFRKQCAPFEVEFPVFCVSLPDNQALDIERFRETMQGFGCRFYHINNHINQILEQRQEGMNISEFGIDLSEDGKTCKKIRFYLRNGSLLISSICTHPIYQKDLMSNILFEGTIYEELWKYITEKINEQLKDENYYKTLCVALNFIYSIDTFVYMQEMIKDCISRSLEGIPISFKFSQREVLILFGQEIADFMQNWYERTFYTNKTDVSNMQKPMSVNGLYLDDEYLPNDFKFRDYYYAVQNRLPKKFENVSGMLNALFYIQNVMLDKMNRYFFLIKEERLKYGHTFGSLAYILEKNNLGMSDLKNRMDMHRWVDAHIDSATIVPQYIKRNNAEDETVWLRVFRSGENELYFISHWTRLCIAILIKELELTGTGMIAIDYFNSLTTWIYKKFSLINYFFDDSIYKYETHTYKLYMSTEEKLVSIYDTLYKLEIIIEPQNGYVTLNENLLDIELTKASVLPEEVMDNIIEYLTLLHKDFPYIEDYKFYIPFFDAKLYDGSEIKENEDYLEKIFSFLKDIVNENFNDNSVMVKQFLSLKKMIYTDILSKKTHTQYWTNTCSEDNESLNQQIDELIKKENKKGELILLQIINSTLIGVIDKKTFILLREIDNTNVKFLIDYVSGIQENHTSNILFFKKIIERGKQVWRF